MNETKLYIYGAAAHGKVLADMAEESGWRVAGAFDKNLLRETLLGQYPVHMDLGNMTFEEDDCFVVAISNNEYRKRVAEQELKGHKFAVLQDKTASVSKYAEVEPGTVLLPYAVIAADVQLGKHCIIGTHASIDADCLLEDYVHISSAVCLGSDVLVGEGTDIATGARVLPGVTIGKWCCIGEGTVVAEDVADGMTVSKS